MSAPQATGKLGRRLAIVASLVVLATVVASVWVTGSPYAHREARLDLRRAKDLDKIVDAIRSHAQEHNALPATLGVLGGKPGIRLDIVDPATGALYEYAATGARTYRLCARFSTDTAQLPPNDYPYNGPHWAHGAGRQCFERTAATETGLPSD